MGEDPPLASPHEIPWRALLSSRHFGEGLFSVGEGLFSVGEMSFPAVRRLFLLRRDEEVTVSFLSGKRSFLSSKATGPRA